MNRLREDLLRGSMKSHPLAQHFLALAYAEQSLPDIALALQQRGGQLQQAGQQPDLPGVLRSPMLQQLVQLELAADALRRAGALYENIDGAVLARGASGGERMILPAFGTLTGGMDAGAPEIRAALAAAARERILVLDGAMGTEIQNRKFSEEDFRAERFAQWNHPLKGNHDILCLTRPDLVRRVITLAAPVHPHASGHRLIDLARATADGRRAGECFNT